MLVWNHRHQEIATYLECMQQHYARALAESDLEGMSEISSELSRVYFLLNCPELGTRWAEEFTRLSRILVGSAVR